MFVGQRVRWIKEPGHRPYIQVDQNKSIETLSEIGFDKSLRDDQVCGPSLHTLYRSVLGQINWLQSRTQYHSGYCFSRCASSAASPDLGRLSIQLLSFICLIFRQLKQVLQEMPELVAGFHSFVGLAAVFAGLANFFNPAGSPK